MISTLLSWGLAGRGWVVENGKALLVLLAFSSVVTVGVGAYQMGRAGERLDRLVELNRGLADALENEQVARDIEHQNSIAMQEQLNIVIGSSDEANRRLRELEKINVEVKDFLSTRTPDAMRGLLTGKDPAAAR